MFFVVVLGYMKIPYGLIWISKVDFFSRLAFPKVLKRLWNQLKIV